MQQEIAEYQMFTTPAQLHKAVNTLRGIVAGITTDTKIGTDEINELIHWCQLHAHLANRHPFSELLPAIEAACEDGVVTDDEAKDILWLCNNFTDNTAYYDAVTSSIQFLSGLIHGIMADGQLEDAEVLALEKWLSVNQFLAGTYPYDEINSLLHAVLKDKIITQQEKDTLSAFFSTFIEFKDSLNLVESEYDELRQRCGVDGICAHDPDIIIPGRIFCLTGEFTHGSRQEMFDLVVRGGGIPRTTVNKKTDYLVVGNSGNPCWAYSCYGRKIEEAVNLRRQGAKVMIIHENDFWKAVTDSEA